MGEAETQATEYQEIIHIKLAKGFFKCLNIFSHHNRPKDRQPPFREKKKKMSKHFQESLVQAETRWSVEFLTTGPLVCLGRSPTLRATALHSGFPEHQWKFSALGVPVTDTADTSHLSQVRRKWMDPWLMTSVSTRVSRLGGLSLTRTFLHT